MKVLHPYTTQRETSGEAKTDLGRFLKGRTTTAQS